MAIIGQEIEDYVASQINVRQKLHGSGTSYSSGNEWITDYRTESQIALLNSNTAWVKLASGVSVSSEKLHELGLSAIPPGMGLAKSNILYAGLSTLQGDNRLTQRGGFNPEDAIYSETYGGKVNPALQDSNSKTYKSSYTYGDYGYSPMPGIISADVKALNRGSLKKATVKIKVNNKQQFDIIDVLYLRLGYTVILEWGNSIFTTDGVNKDVVRNTLIDDSSKFFNEGFSENRSYRDILGPIESYRKKYAGNYDGLLGKVSNFQWSFNKDGSYDIEITIISLGDVVESLKLNIPTDKKFGEFIQQDAQATAPSSTPEDQPDPIEENKDANAITSMLWAWKYTNPDPSYESYDDSLYIRLGTGDDKFVGGFLKTSKTLTQASQRYKFTYYYEQLSEGNTGYDRIILTQEDDPKFAPSYQDFNYAQSFLDLSNAIEAHEIKLLSSKGKDEKVGNTTIYKTEIDGVQRVISVQHEPAEFNASTIDSPISNAPKYSAVWLNTEPHQFYLRFGYLMQFIKQKLVPKVNTKASEHSGNPSMFNILYDVGLKNFTQTMYSPGPAQISLDPRVCIVRNDAFPRQEDKTAEVFHHLLPFRAKDNKEDKENIAYIFNIYLNFEFIIECLNSNTDERGDISVYNFLKAICDGLNKALGGVNNLEPIVDEESNTLKIIDTTPIPGDVTQQKYTLQLYGYDKMGNGSHISNFVRNVDLKTAITPEYATMITVGATAGGYVKGTEATAFSRWNAGLTDRFNKELLPGDVNSMAENGEDEAVTNYLEKFLKKTTACYGFSGNLMQDPHNLKISTDAIETNLSVMTEFFKYVIASNKTKNGGTVGFIPFKISFTMDGISGIKIYNKLHVDTRFLPKAYGEALDLIVTGVSHKLQKNDWETDIEATVIPKTSGDTSTTTTTQVSGSAPGGTTTGEDAPLGTTPPSTGWEIIHDFNPKYKPGTVKGNNIDLLIKTFKDQGVTNPYAIVAMLCVVGKEGGYEPVAENLNYSYGQLVDKERTPWGFFAETEENKKIAYHLTRGKYFGYKGGKETFANYIYGWKKSLPPGFREDPYGNTKWGDGYKYRGRGFNQITWKGQYESYGKKIGIDLVKYPDKLLEPEIAAKVCFLFFRDRFKNAGYDPIAHWNKYSSIDAAIIQFANANGGNVRETASHGASTKAKAQRKNFDIITK